MKKLGAAQPSKKVGCVVVNVIVSILFKTSNTKPPKSEKTDVKKKCMKELRQCKEKLTLMILDFTAK